MEEINLKELLDYFKDRILIIAIIVLGILVVGCFYSIFIKVPLYQSSSQVVLVSSGENGGYNTSDVSIIKSLIGTYSSIVKSDSVVDTVISNLSLDYSTSYLKGNITVSNPTDTSIIKISVTDKDPKVAAMVTDEVVKVFSEEVTRIYQLQNVSVIDKAKENENPSNINVMKDIVIYLVVGLVLSLGIIFVIFYFDTTIKSTEDVENKLGLPVFGVVPRANRNKTKSKK